MASKYSQDAPEDFRDALATGQVLRWLKGWLIFGALMLVLAGLFWVIVHLFPRILQPKGDHARANTRVESNWRTGDPAPRPTSARTT